MPNTSDNQPIGDRAVTRSVSERIPGLLNVPDNSLTSRRRRSPFRRSPFGDEEGIFTFNMATAEQLAQIRDELRNEIRAEVRQETAAAAAAVPDAIKRKPEIPPFDKVHVEHWIRRTENAFIRALITSPREKFAFLETKFPVDFNPRINDFLWGDPTQANWDEFIAYLKSEYGSTKQQQAAIILNGFKRDGKKPSQYVALLEDKTKDIDIDDVRKEMLVREMPTDVQRMLQERIEGLSLKDAAKIADSYFDQDGKPRHFNKSAPINAVQEPSLAFTSAFADESDDINSVGRRYQGQQTRGTNYSQRGGRGRMQRGGQQRPTATQQTPAPQPKPKPTNNPSWCFYHNEYGNSAKKCEVGCSRYDEKRFAGNGKAGPR